MTIQQVSCRAEYDPITMVLLCEPGADLLYALALPEAANFEKGFDSREAIRKTIEAVLKTTLTYRLVPHAQTPSNLR